MKNLRQPLILPRQINDKVYEEAKRLKLPHVIAEVVAKRPVCEEVSLEAFLNPKLQDLSIPNLSDIDIASTRLAKAIIDKECIGIETDHDCDGQTSHAIIYDNLIRHFHHPKDRVRSYIGHRLEEGYGLSLPLTKRILNDSQRPSLVVTADNGSTDEPRIAILKENNIDVIVTDHHQIPREGVPKSAIAVLNPTREDCEYPDPYIAGCMVAWLLMAATRNKLITMGHLSAQAPKLMDTLDYVAVGTIADCVSMAKSHNNRIVVSYGLNLINQGTRCCWQVLKEHLGQKINSESVGFGIGPLLNSDGRLDTAFKSVSFLLSGSIVEAKDWLAILCEQNEKRKSIQHEITSKGMEIATLQVANGDHSVRVFFEDGHPGVHGISASRLKDSFGRPVVFLARKVNDPSRITGSLRGIDGFDIKGSLSKISEQEPGIFEAFGGHFAAGGLTVKEKNLPLFMQRFEQFCQVVLSKEQIGPRIFVDAHFEGIINNSYLEQQELLEPFGREFESPVYYKDVLITQMRWVGNGTHLRMQFSIGSRLHWGIWFSARQSEQEQLGFCEGQNTRLIFSLKRSTFKPAVPDVMIKSCIPIG